MIVDKHIERDIDGNIIGIYSCIQFDENDEDRELEILNESSQDLICCQSIKDKSALIKTKQISINASNKEINRYLSQIEAQVTPTLTSTEFNTKVGETETLLSDISTLETEIETLMENIRTL